VSYEELESLRSKLSQLEQQAGITKKVEDAKLGPFLPDPNWSSAEYFRETEDHARRKVRDLYFAVQDMDLRKQLIATRRACERQFQDNIRAGIAESRAALAKAKASAESQAPYIKAAVAAAIAVALGAILFQMYGAIAGALVGFFLGLSTLARGKKKRAEVVESVQTLLDVKLKDQRDEGIKPAWFNSSEEQAGERDKHFDRESVIANYYGAKREGSTN
jgi:hypothetical protein